MSVSKTGKRLGRPPKEGLGKQIPWKDELLPVIYDLAKQGMADRTIARALGSEYHQFKTWRRTRPMVRLMLDKAREQLVDGERESFKDFIYNRLSPQCRKVWDQLMKCDAAEDVEGALTILARCGKWMRQHLFFYALLHFDFNPSEACRVVNIPSHLLRKWTFEDPKFRELLDEINWHKANFFEGALIRLVKKGDTAAVIFANKTFNKKRGYSEKIDVNMTDDQETTRLEDLELPLETRRQILEAMRKKQNQSLPALEDKTQVQDAEFEVKNGNGKKTKTKRLVDNPILDTTGDS